MSSLDDDFSDDSFDELTSGREDPPTLDETLFDITLFTLFLNYMKSQNAGAPLLFLKQARLLRLYNAPPAVYTQQVIKTIWAFFAECAKSPIEVSHDVRKKLQEYALDPDMEAKINKDTLSLAFAEVYNAVVPCFYDWLATNEWHDAVPFHRLPPPTFRIVLSSGSLSLLFNKYLKSQLEQDSDGSVSKAYHLWKFCIVAYDFHEGKYTHLLEGRKKKGKDGDSDDKSETSSVCTEGGKDVDAEEYAKRVYKKYSHYISLQYEASSSYSNFILNALDKACEEFEKNPIFLNWAKLKQYQGVDYQAKVVTQSLTAEGYAEPPTLAGVLCSSLLHFLLVMLSGRESGLNVEFLMDVWKFRQTYDSEKSVSSSSGSKESRKEMVEEARRIFAKYLEPGTMYCDPHLVEEVRNAITKSSGKGVNASTFRKCGAFIYHRSEHSWCRQARATIVWTNKSYDNHCEAAQAIEEEFSMSVLPEGIDLQIVPTIDDTLAHPLLLRDYAEFVGKEPYEAFMHFRDAYEEYFKAPAGKRKPLMQKVARAYGDFANLFPKLKPIHHVIAREVGRRDRIADSVFPFLSYTIIHAITKKYYSKWLVERSMTWKSVPWTPVPTITYSDMSGVYGMSSVERKIEEAALKGKTGFSRFLAKRAVKRNTVANVRTAGQKVSSELSTTVFSTTSASDMLSFASPRPTMGEVDEGEPFSFAVPVLFETLSSTYLRRHFEKNYLKGVLSLSELSLWDALCIFYAKYCAMDGEGLCNDQDEMRREIDEICTKYHSLIKGSHRIKEQAKKQKIIFPHFFRPLETELYGKHHEAYKKAFLEHRAAGSSTPAEGEKPQA